jgi:hypothetical protein
MVLFLTMKGYLRAAPVRSNGRPRGAIEPPLRDFDVKNRLPENGIEAAPAAVAADQVHRPVGGTNERRGSIAKIGFAGV